VQPLADRGPLAALGDDELRAAHHTGEAEITVGHDERTLTRQNRVPVLRPRIYNVVDAPQVLRCALAVVAR